MPEPATAVEDVTTEEGEERERVEPLNDSVVGQCCPMGNAWRGTPPATATAKATAAFQGVKSKEGSQGKGLQKPVQGSGTSGVG